MDGDAGGAGVLSRRALNRATLARQLLLRRSDMTPLEAVGHLVGMQAQAPLPPYFGLWTRLNGFRPDDLVRLLLDRQVVRVVLMRGTVHLVTAADCLTLRPILQPMLDRYLLTNSTYRAGLVGIDLDEVAAAGRELLEERPRTTAEVAPLLAERWPSGDLASLAQVLRSRLPLVQVPPRGVWGKGGQPVCTTAEAWLGRPLAPDPSPAEMVTRYLAAFGPATVNDMQTWSGLTRLKEVVDTLRERLRTFRDEEGRELFDLPSAPRPDPEIPAPPRFLAAFDNLLLSHVDRTRVISDDHRRLVFTQNGLVKGTILVDGFVSGFWELERRRRCATLLITPFVALSRQDVGTLTHEGKGLLDFAADGGETREIRFAAAA